MAFTLPDLPYAYDALVPHMSRETLRVPPRQAPPSLRDCLQQSGQGHGVGEPAGRGGAEGYVQQNQALFNNAGQHYNHIHFWQWMRKGGGGDKLPGKLEKQIASDIGPIAKFKEDFVQAGVTQFGSGWCWLRQRRQADAHENAQRRKPAGARRQAHPRLRCLGTLLLRSIIATADPIISRLSSIIWLTGTTWRRCTTRR